MTIYHRILYSRVIEIHKIKNNIALQIAKGTFEPKKNIYNLRSTLRSNLIRATACNAKSKSQSMVFNQ